MTGLGAALRRFMACCKTGAPSRCAPPSAEPAAIREAPAERGQVPNPFGPALTELRCALSCFDLVDEVACADHDGPTDRNRLAHAYAAWALAGAARRAAATYADQVEDGVST